MTPSDKDFDDVANAMELHFKDVYANPEDCASAWAWTNNLLMLLLLYRFPLDDRRFIEILRAVANAFDVLIDKKAK